MKANLRSVTVRLVVFLAVCLVGVFGLYAVFGQLRFGEKTHTYKAAFTNVTGLENNDFVRIAGVEVGQVKNVAIQPDTTALVEFTADDSVVLTEGSRAVIRYNDLIGGRYLALEDKLQEKPSPTARAALGRSYIFTNRFSDAIPVLTAAAAEMKTNATN